MAWPTNKPDSDKFSSDGDSIKDSRPELKKMSDAVNDIVDFVDTTGIQNGDVLVYDSTSGTIKPGAGGGGGISGNTLTADLETNGFIIGHLAPDSSGATNPTGIQFTDSNFINLISTNRYYPDSAGDPKYPGAGTVFLRNYIPNRVSATTGQPIPQFDYSTLSLYSSGSYDSAGDDEISVFNVTYGGRGFHMYHQSNTPGGTGTSAGLHEIKISDTDGILIQNTIGQDSATSANADLIRIKSKGEIELDSLTGVKIKQGSGSASVSFTLDPTSTTNWGIQFPDQPLFGYLKMYQVSSGVQGLLSTTDPNTDYDWQGISGTGTLTSGKTYYAYGGGSITLSLPAGGSVASGDTIQIVKDPSTTVNINPNTNNLDGSSANYTMNSGWKGTYQSGSGWMTISVGK